MSKANNPAMFIQITQIVDAFKQTLHLAASSTFGLLTIAAVCGPLLDAPGSQALQTMLHGFCHQLAERCYVIDGQQMPICARCLGVSIGVSVAAFGALCGGEATRFWTLRLGIGGCVWIVASWLAGFGLPPAWHLERTIAGMAGGAGLYILGCCLLDATTRFACQYQRLFAHRGPV